MQTIATQHRSSLPRLAIANGTLESLKWIAIVLMTFDHVNKYLLRDSVSWMFDIGRVAMPLFVFVLAYNLARPDALKRGAYQRTTSRLAVFGTLASPAFMALGGLVSYWWPLNIMFTLLTITASLYFIERGGIVNLLYATGIAIVGGSSVEFWWPAVIFGIAVWHYTKRPSMSALLIGVIACALLGIINRDMWAMMALVVIALSAPIKLIAPRFKWAIYAYYPAHLSALWLIRLTLRHFGHAI